MSRLLLRRLLGGLLVAAALGFVAALVLRDLPRVRAYDWEVRPALLALSLLGLSATLVWGVRVWQLVLRRFGVRIRLAPLCRIWFLSNVARYIPGVIWQFVGIAQFSTAAGLNAAVALSSLFVQLGFTLVAALLVAVLLVPPGGWGLPVLHALRWLAPAALLAVHPRLIGGALALVRRATRKELVAWHGSWGDGVWLLALNAVSWLVYGGAFYLFVESLAPVGWHNLGALVAMNALAFVAGYVAVLAPAGLGAKEAALTVTLATVLPAPVAAALALAARLWTVAGEMLPTLFFVRAGRSVSRTSPTPRPNHAGRAEDQAR